MILRRPSLKFLAFLAVIVICGYLFAFDRLVHQGIIALAVAKTGAQMEIALLQTMLFDGRAQAQGLRLTAPDKTPPLDITIDSVDLQFSLSDLARRRYVIRDGSLHGIRIVQNMDITDGDFISDTIKNRLRREFPGLAIDDIQQNLFNLLEKRPEDMARELVRTFQMTRTADEISRSWQREYEQLQPEIDAFETTIRRARELIEGRGANPLEAAAFIVTELQRLEQSAQTLQNTIPRIQRMVAENRTKIEEAARADQQLFQALAMPGLNPHDLTASLIGNEINDHLVQILAWTDQAREMANIQTPEHYRDTPFDQAVKRRTGTNMFFTGELRGAEYHVRHLDMDGEIIFRDSIFGDSIIYFAGIIKDAGNRPELSQAPTALHFGFSGRPVCAERLEAFAAAAVNMETLIAQSHKLEISDTEMGAIPDIYVTVLADRTDGVLRDRLIVVCPAWSLPRRRLGDERVLAFDAAPGLAKLVAIIDRQQDSLSGTIRMMQSSAGLTPILPVELRDKPLDLERLLTDGMAGLDGFDVEARLSGTVGDLHWRFDSNLGHRIVAQWDHVLRDQWQRTRQEIVNELNASHALASMSGDETLQQIQTLLSAAGVLRTQSGPNVSPLPIPENVEQRLQDEIQRGLNRLFR